MSVGEINHDPHYADSVEDKSRARIAQLEAELALSQHMLEISESVNKTLTEVFLSLKDAVQEAYNKLSILN